MSNKWYQIELLRPAEGLVTGGLRPFAGTGQAMDANVCIAAGTGLQRGATASPGAPTLLLSELDTKDVLQT